MNDFGGLLEKEIPRLRRYARALTRDMSRADDLVPDTIERAIAKQHFWRWGSSPSRITRMQTSSDAAFAKAEPSRSTIPAHSPIRGHSAQRRPIRHGDWRMATGARDLDRALARLGAEQRQVILLVGLESNSYSEAATILDVPIGMIRSPLARGRTALRTLMDRKGGT
jgi:RNA polymerase sigma-70 factor, ECF subfamily